MAEVFSVQTATDLRSRISWNSYFYKLEKAFVGMPLSFTDTRLNFAKVGHFLDLSKLLKDWSIQLSEGGDASSDNTVSGCSNTRQAETRQGGLFVGGTTMAHSELVDNVNGASGGSTVDYSNDKTDSHYSKHEQNSSVSSSVDSGGMSVIRKSLENRGISEDSADIIMASWQDSTKKQYTVYRRKWFLFCSEKQISSVHPNLNSVLDFLTKLYHEGIAYKTMNHSS